jgi:hypothetical protein
MPNYCKNVIDILGEYNSLRGIVAVGFDFNAICPEPDDVEDWYDWRMKNWGCKWNAIDPELTWFSNHHLLIKFDTAWYPPISLLQCLSKKENLLIRFSYDEEGVGFYGHGEIRDGEIVEHIHREYTEADFECMVNQQARF